MRLTNGRLKVEDACGKIHALLTRLPIYHSPNEVGFKNGLYFFYEDGERDKHGLREGRIVRVGNHPRAQNGLIQRLSNHYSGNKNGSVFRRLLGGALIRRTSPRSPCLAPCPGKGHWERQNSTACANCNKLEAEVSAYIRRHCHFRCVAIINRQQRNRFEALLIATIAQCSRCTPSKSWRGWRAYPQEVRSASLWNVQHVGDQAITLNDLRVFAKLVHRSVKK